MIMRVLLCCWWAVLPLRSELPFIDSGDWRGYFAVHEAQRYDFSFRNDGEMTLIPKNRGRDWVAVANRLGIEFGIEEMRPDGVVCKQTRQGSLESEQEATDDIGRLVIRGTTTGDAVYELVIEQSREVISLGGRVVDPGKLTEHPLRFAVRISVPNTYRRVELLDRNDQREFDRLSRRDYLELARTDHSKLSLDNDDSDPLDGEALTGVGIESLEMRLSYYEGRRFFFEADRGSGMAILEDRTPGAWYEGLTLIWTPDPLVDTEGKSRLRLWIK